MISFDSSKDRNFGNDAPWQLPSGLDTIEHIPLYDNQAYFITKCPLFLTLGLSAADAIIELLSDNVLLVASSSLIDFVRQREQRPLMEEHKTKRPISSQTHTHTHRV